MSAFQFETRLADLQNRYAQDNAAQEYGRFLGQQRFSRQREGMNRDYMRQFPQFTGRWAGRLGDGVKSGVFNESLTNNVNDFGRSMGQVDQDEAGFQGNFAATQAQREAAYRRALLALNEDFAAQRANQNPFVGVV